MDWLYAIIGLFAIMATAILLGWTERKVKSRTAKVFIWIGAILALLTMRFGWRSFLLFLLLSLRILENVPSWVFYATGIGSFCCACWYIFNLLGNGIIEISQELQQTKNRLAMMENSLSDIARRLPEGE